MNWVLSHGTWYVGKSPLLVKAWGAQSVVDNIPLWVKFSKIPDCYWTRKGLSYLGSVIGSPLCADDRTSKLDILPFAKMCVNYKIGDELPDKIEVEALDPVSGATTVEVVQVSYPAKPLICSSCRSLGHKAGACPGAKRSWVLKPKQSGPPTEPPSEEKDPNPDANQNATEVPVNVDPKISSNPSTVNVPAEDPRPLKEANMVDVSSPLKEVTTADVSTPLDNNEGWQTVKTKRWQCSPTSDDSPSPTNISQGPKLAAQYSKLSKSDRKKQKRSLESRASHTAS